MWAVVIVVVAPCRNQLAGMVEMIDMRHDLVKPATLIARVARLPRTMAPGSPDTRGGRSRQAFVRLRDGHGARLRGSDGTGRGLPPMAPRGYGSVATVPAKGRATALSGSPSSRSR